MSSIKGIVLRSVNLNESDAILSLLTPLGKVSIKAKGILKINSKNRKGCQVLTHSYFHCLDQNGKSVLTLKNCEVIDYFRSIHEDLLRQALAFCMLEICDRMHEDDLLFQYDELLQFLNLLEKCKNPWACYAFFLSTTLKRSGIGIVVDECVNCGSQKNICSFSIKDGGLICTQCFDLNLYPRLNVEQIRNLRVAYHFDFEHYDEYEALCSIDYGTIDLLAKCYEMYGELPLKSQRFLLSLQKLEKI